MASNIRHIRGRLWDVQRAAREMGRFEFIAYFLARQTRTKAGREPVDGYRVIKRRDGWKIDWNGMLVHEPKSFHALFEIARRSPLAYHVRQAEEFRCDLLAA